MSIDMTFARGLFPQKKSPINISAFFLQDG